MANLLLTPDLWTDGNGANPPAAWNGDAYYWAQGAGSDARILTLASPTDGQIRALATFDAGDSGVELAQVLISSDDDQTTDIPTGVPTFIDFDGTGITTLTVLSNGEEEFLGNLNIIPSTDPAPVEPPQCDEIGRVTRARVSAYNRTREHVSVLRGNEQRCLIADFNGTIPKSRTLASATWQMSCGGWLNISAPFCNDRQTGITVAGMWGSVTWIRCSATLDNGEIYTQQFRVIVRGTPWYPLDTFTWNGQQSLSATNT